MRTSDEFLFMLFIIFLGLGFIMPIVNNDLNENSSTPDNDNLKNNIGQTQGDDFSSVNLSDYVKSISLMFFFTFGAIPLWMDAIIFIPLRLLFWTLIINKIRGI